MSIFSLRASGLGPLLGVLSVLQCSRLPSALKCGICRAVLCVSGRIQVFRSKFSTPELAGLNSQACPTVPHDTLILINVSSIARFLLQELNPKPQTDNSQLSAIKAP